MNHTNDDSMFEFFHFRRMLKIDPWIQIVIVTTLYVSMTMGYFFEFQKTGKMDGYEPGVSLLFVPIYEELLFRGVILKYFKSRYGGLKSIIFVSIFFGLWHLKNIFWLDKNTLIQQMSYTALLFSPIICWITLKTRSVWPAVILHYLNNFPYTAWLDALKN